MHYANDERAAREVLDGLPGAGHALVRADLGGGEARDLAARSLEELGRVDVLVNNAGIYEGHPVLTTSAADWEASWQRTMATNLFGPADLIHALVPHMAERGGGRIVNVTSRGAFRGEPDHAAYGASKAALNSLSQSMAKALAPHGIYVTSRGPRVRGDRHGCALPRRARGGGDHGTESDGPGGLGRGDRPGGGLPR